MIQTPCEFNGTIMVNPADINAIESGTQTNWHEWRALFDADSAAEPDHNAVAIIARDLKLIFSWPAQRVVVAYEGYMLNENSCFEHLICHSETDLLPNSSIQVAA